mmetsp:Transcript_37175/g.81707  ORF Transcript_37175/g.81707 Transcript_37175/m.81707 type:complete len:214 (-) Transcript_37175:321-962(-)
MSSCDTLAQPLAAATCNGVSPLCVITTLVDAPCCSRSSTASVLPALVADSSGVMPEKRVRASTCTPRWSSSLATPSALCAIARCSAFSPASLVRLTSAPCSMSVAAARVRADSAAAISGVTPCAMVASTAAPFCNSSFSTPLCPLLAAACTGSRPSGMPVAPSALYSSKSRAWDSSPASAAATNGVRPERIFADADAPDSSSNREKARPRAPC